MFWLKSCPHCTGDLLEAKDQYGRYVTCIQCGFSKDVPAGNQRNFVLTTDPTPAPVSLTSGGLHRIRTNYIGRIPIDSFLDAAEEAV